MLAVLTRLFQSDVAEHDRQRMRDMLWKAFEIHITYTSTFIYTTIRGVG